MSRIDGQDIIRCKRIYKVNKFFDGTINQYKASLVAKVYAQNYGLDYKEIFSPVTKM